MKFFEELYNGNFNPNEHFWQDNKAYMKTLKKLDENMEVLNAMLSEDAKEALEKFLDTNAELSYIIEVERFKSGFRLGGQMVYNCFFD